MHLQAAVQEAVKAVCPLKGEMSFPVLADRATWKFTPADHATEQEKAAARLAIVNFVHRRKRSKAAIAAAFAGLASSQKVTLRQEVIDQLVFERIQENPNFATNLGISLEGDEPDV